MILLKNEDFSDTSLDSPGLDYQILPIFIKVDIGREQFLKKKSKKWMLN